MFISARGVVEGLILAGGTGSVRLRRSSYICCWTDVILTAVALCVCVCEAGDQRVPCEFGASLPWVSGELSWMLGSGWEGEC